MQKGTSFKKNRPGYYNYKSPLLFSIPLDVYSDEVVKLRDRDSFKKLQKLQKKCEELRKSFESVKEQHCTRIETTRDLVLRTIAVNINIRGRRIEY
ncbi:hypothetical protein [Segetibacter aerophilus]|uniref:Uncharacterized protein n=1 Tax=Segetibacter aerophilus TaxID=670293 RepID=A0A512BHK9_9BACT|nr:hypothetical protein [Segetibacter aerophilus]GEO11307.1 hypothetical protein SAE01_38030 [Segetibacter aerophilus]